MISLAILTLMYFLPTVCAVSRKHRSAAAIFVLNFLLGWTVIGWFVALVWSLGANVEQPQVVIYYPPPVVRR